MLYLLNAFSLNMLPPFMGEATIRVRKLTLKEVQTTLEQGFASAIGHEDTARVLSSMLGLEVPVNRVSIQLNPGDRAIVAQYKGPRLPEGATTLPDGATLEFYLVSVEQ